jgi:hypothetical protein
VSKFFYGGYSLEGDVSPHTHSNDARKTVNGLVVGYLGDRAEKRLMRVSGIEREANMLGSIKTIRFMPVIDTSDNYSRINDEVE